MVTTGSTDLEHARFRAVEAARFGFLAAVSSMSRGEQAPDVDYLLRLADMVLEVHDQSVTRPARSCASSELG